MAGGFLPCIMQTNKGQKKKKLKAFLCSLFGIYYGSG